MGIFLTGSTGYIGAHVAANLLRTSDETLLLPVRAGHQREAAERLWRALQLHMEFGILMIIAFVAAAIFKW